MSFLSYFKSKQTARRRTFRWTPKITQTLVQEYLDYIPETGWLIWKKKPSQLVKIGDRAGYLDESHGYRHIRLKEHCLLEHRLIWLYVHGEWPADREIDHINFQRDDNRLINIRRGTTAQNRANRKAGRTNTGIRNVYRLKSGRFNVHMTLGTYDTKEEAAQVAYQAAKKLYGEFVTPEMYGLTETPTYAKLNS